MCREALSARIDGEDEPAPAEQTDEHLQDCSACQAWQTRAVELSRSMRVREAPVVPDLTAAVMAKAPPIDDTRGWWPRLALGGVAVAQLGLAMSQMFGAGTTAEHAQHGGVPVASHLFNESTAWNFALGLGLLWAAFRPRVTAGVIPVLAGFVVVLLAYSTYDVVTGAAPVARVVGHGLLVAALCLLVVVNRTSGDPAPRGAGRLGTPIKSASSKEDPAVASTETPKGRTPLRPAGRHRAA